MIVRRLANKTTLRPKCAPRVPSNLWTLPLPDILGPPGSYASSFPLPRWCPRLCARNRSADINSSRFRNKAHVISCRPRSYRLTSTCTPSSPHVPSPRGPQEQHAAYHLAAFARENGITRHPVASPTTSTITPCTTAFCRRRRRAQATISATLPPSKLPIISKLQYGSNTCHGTKQSSTSSIATHLSEAVLGRPTPDVSLPTRAHGQRSSPGSGANRKTNEPSPYPHGQPGTRYALGA